MNCLSEFSLLLFHYDFSGAHDTNEMVIEPLTIGRYLFQVAFSLKMKDQRLYASLS